MVSSGPELQTKEEVYCFSLAKALYCGPTPVTVGFYAPWGHCKNFLLQKIQNYMHMESRKKDHQEVQRTGQSQRGSSGRDLLKVLLLMIFYRPVLTAQQRQRRNIQHIFIRFSAWEYAGSDQLWAGLITTLCDGIEDHFGLLPMSFYRAVGRKSSILDAPLEKEWVSKRYLCLPLWAAVILLITVAVVVGVLILVLGVPVGDISGDAIVAVEGVGAAAVGISAAAAIRIAILVVRNLVVNQKAQLESQMNRTDLSAQLGFMSSVKREVQVVIRFLRFMEIFQRRKIRVVLEITNLDRCSPDKVVGVLDAMNILLSDYDAPFISILAVDSKVVVDCVESSTFMKGMANNGYEFLNRVITLPFSVPRMDCETKVRLLRDIVECRKEQEKDPEDGTGSQTDTSFPLVPHYSLANHGAGNPNPDECHVPLMDIGPSTRGPSNGCTRKAVTAKEIIREAFDSLVHGSMKEYMTENIVQMRRIVNTIAITVRLIVQKVPKDEVRPEMVAAWVLLANQWPCRLSWILQCIEDEEQRNNPAGCQGNALPPDMPLWEVYEKYMEEFDLMKGSMEKLLELDRDPELFHNFLCGRFQVKDANFYLPFTVNLDPSLQRQMELQRGSRSLKRTKKARGLSRCTLLRMTVEEVCEEMATLGFKEGNLQLYKERVEEQQLNGRALIYSDNGEIKEALGMSVGEWTLFSMHFLGVLPQASPSGVVVSSVPQCMRQAVQKNIHSSRGSWLSLNLSREDLLERR
ncbi:NTPase KAP family P-loop domain-containing protein 1-like [Alligator sinensis]|uniref:NTPase KAP family P-loop domain-containing protein 1-like n=1 Tax=Alligator sinensis TaxID=38654 RepID=A0A1U8DEI6_ALLSI|nr:NTPase KAP family P-loop domain-containing protein 1-like [Alligator sinensis]